MEDVMRLKARSMAIYIGAACIAFGACATPNYGFISEPGKVSVSPPPKPSETALPHGHFAISPPEIVDFNVTDKGSAVHSLRLRVSVVNEESQDSWYFGTQEQAVRFSTPSNSYLPAVEPFYSSPYLGAGNPRKTLKSVKSVKSVDHDGRIARILPGETQIIDLYFRLPPGAKTVADVPGFEFDWKLALPAQRKIVRGTTPYDRVTRNQDLARLHPQAFAGYLPPIQPAYGPGYGQDAWITQNFSVWTFDKPVPPPESPDDELPPVTVYSG
jgi:hypothetical protein